MINDDRSPIQKCVDLMLGIAIGDAFGAGYESLPPDEVRRRYNLKYSKSPHKRATHVRAHYTDDTQMSLALAELLASEQEFSDLSLAAHLHAAYHRDKRPGYSRRTLSALERPSATDFLEASEKSTTNGAAMRAVPIGVVADLGRVIRYGRVNAMTTHKTPEAAASSIIVALAAHYFFYRLGDSLRVFDFCLEHVRAPEAAMNCLEKLSHMAVQGAFDPLQIRGWDRNSGLSLDGIGMAGAAVFLAAGYGEPTSLLNGAVRLGGDTDTVASIALGLYAARRPLDSLPSFLFRELENGAYGRDYIIQVGKRLATIVPMPVVRYQRLKYSGDRQWLITHLLDGVVEPIDSVYLLEVMRKLMSRVEYTEEDVIVGLDAGGYIPALAAACVTGLRVITAKKAELAEVPGMVHSIEEHTAYKDVFVYLPRRPRRVVIVDDEITTGRTVLNLANALRDHGVEVVGAVVPVESTLYGARELLASHGLPLISHTRHDKA